MKNIMQEKKECYLCRYMLGDGIDLPKDGLELHHIFGGTANRAKSTKHGLVCWLCPEHHRLCGDAVHRNSMSRSVLMEEAQKKFEEEHTREEFIAEFGKSVL